MKNRKVYRIAINEYEIYCSFFFLGSNDKFNKHPNLKKSINFLFEFKFYSADTAHITPE